MLFLVLAVIILFFLFADYSNNGGWCTLWMVILLIVYVICLGSVIGTPAYLLSVSETLEEEKEYIMSLPSLPVMIDVSHEKLDIFLVEIDMVNSNLATEILNTKINIYEKIQKYNQKIYFWEKHPKLAYGLWLWPNPAKEIEKLNLKLISLELER